VVKLGTYYVARLRDEGLVSIYSDKKGIMARFFENGSWGDAQLLLEEALPSFTAEFDDSGSLCIFAQSRESDIVRISYNGTRLSQRTVLSGQSSNKYNMRVQQLQSGSLVYNVPADGSKFKLIMQSAEEGGWGEPEEIATAPALPGHDGAFELQLINKGHGLVFYSSENNVIGYKEISPTQTCEFIPISRPGEIVLDCSFLTLQSGVYVVYVIANLFSQRLLYRRKVSEKFSEPIILWEGMRIEKPMISEINREIWAHWLFGENLYIAKAEESNSPHEATPKAAKLMGSAEVYTQKFCKRPVVASYIVSGDGLRNIYVDSARPWDVQILPDVLPTFYPIMRSAEPPMQDEKAMPPELVNSDYDRKLQFMTMHAQKLKEENEKLKTLIEKKDRV